MYNIAIIGSGPGGYVAAIRAKQLGFNVVVIEKAELGGTCLNWGCIPTKALLKSASVYKYIMNASHYGIEAATPTADFGTIIARSRSVADTMNKGINFLFKKNKIDVVQGVGKLLDNKTIEVTNEDGSKTLIEAEHIILATGARSRDLPNIKRDHKKIIGYREAMTLTKQPKSMLVIGSGAIGMEFAYFYKTIGTDITLVEFMPDILPVEDKELTKLMTRELKKMKMKVMTSSSVTAVDTSGEGCISTIQTPKGIETVESEIVLMAAGVITNIENIGLEDIGVKTERGKIIVDEYYKTSVDGIYAIGDIVPGQALAHVASAEGICCVEKIAGLSPTPVDYANVPGCTYCSPEIASVGLTEEKAIAQGYNLKIGRFPFTASGKATASGNKEGMIKVILNADNDEILGAHFMGENVTEMISEIVVAKKMHVKGYDIMKAIHPHPTMSEAVMEAFEAAYNECIHI
ncbi:MAG: dihydrolipoyl dehydrogenase [Bacteroidales bacterium]|nr:dihydrolipoyl dehydrogenase [Bacteroidales bacterium]MDD2204746.1 dihydrolipoyl dehydrogenase [Bacteroidales bacterium]MDD3151582.1 dihydrolipoyl dehydrogenase [Bacteroidales bacterium]MDD3914169.1 dihydrolipoyl dehydrogenase [Bacteroidales bacterium]MDD4633704.1 dihydrolipoyl dehydrogenase [Bacteroidales bacterium]